MIALVRTGCARIGLEAEAVDVDASINLLDLVQNASETQPIDCVLVDEAQF